MVLKESYFKNDTEKLNYLDNQNPSMKSVVKSRNSVFLPSISELEDGGESF